jgi:hypothetical protein
MKKVITAVIFLTSALGALAQTASAGRPALSAAGGRFVFGQVSDYQRDKYLLDTQTGRMWNIVCIGPEKDGQCPRGLEPVIFVDIKGEPTFAPPALPR